MVMFLLSTFASQAVDVPIFTIRGKGGMTVNGSHVTICPDWSLRVCYRVTVSLDDLWNAICRDGTPASAQIEYYDEETGETINLNMNVISISNSYINGNQEINIPSDVPNGNAFVFE